MKPTRILSDEHKHILKVIDTLVKECDAIEKGKDIDNNFFSKAIDFIRNYADKFHHAKEEDILFVELNKNSGQLHCNPVKQMIYEHNLGRNFVKGMIEGIKQNNKEKVIKNGRGYAQLLQEHIYKEDNVLYPLADRSLDEKTQESVLKKFNQAENKKFGKSVKEKYLSIAKELGRTYKK